MLPNHDAIENMTLRWRGPADQAYVPATQMRVERRFSELDFSPPGLPANAVLFIRSIRNLAPLASLDFIPKNWEVEIRQQIETYYRQAIHPVNGYIPTTAESIIFIDYAEVLAALIPAVIAGRWWNEWPWAEIIPMMQPSAALSTVWGKYIQYLPAAFSLLTPSQIQAAVHLLTPSAVNRVIQELRATFALPEPTIQAPVNIDPDSPLSTSQPTTSDPPWEVWLSPFLSQSDLSPQEYYLVGLIIGLHFAPAYVRSQDFTTRTAHWLLTRPMYQPTEQPRRVMITTRSGEEETVEAYKPTPHIEAAVTRESSQIHEEKTFEASTPTQLAEAATSVDEPTISDENALAAVSDEVTHSSAMLEDGQWTRYAGVLYLINLLGWLGMPQNWDETLTQHISTWGLVELLARALLPDEALHPDDAIWDILAKLDKRDLNSLLASDFPEQSSFRLPAHLLRRFAPKQPHWRASLVEDRLRLLDDTGLYLIAEQPLDGNEPSIVVEAILAEYMGQDIQATWSVGDDYPDEILPPFVNQVCNPALQSWLQRTIGFVRYWLRSIADLEPQEMLVILGRISVTYTHVDLFMPMESIDIRIRKVGLDLNPGWMPDFGYIILFHFEA